MELGNVRKGAIAALLTTTAIAASLVAAEPAAAASCSRLQVKYAEGRTASFAYTPCSDGSKRRVSGTLKDLVTDGKVARLLINYDNDTWIYECTGTSKYIDTGWTHRSISLSVDIVSSSHVTCQ